MKKLLALILAAILIASVLTSCVSLEQRTALDPKITLTSSDAADAAAWLSERLREIPDSVVIGTNADEYGIDASVLEDDGYIIRDLGSPVAILARTTDGLDRAVRKYAKMVEAGSASDATYHEGFRVKRFEIAGRDISEYKIYCEDEARLTAAANEFASLIEKACGAVVPVVTGEAAAPYIALKYVHDEALSTVGYRWEVNSDGLTIECSDGYKPTSAHYAVARFLENELGWFGLTFGYEDLAEAELVSIPAGKSGGEVNAFVLMNPYGDSMSDPANDKFDRASLSLGGVPNCCHGLQNNRFASELSKSPRQDWAQDQPCFLDEEFFEVTYDDISAYIEDKIASGKVLGDDLCFVDIAAGDNSKWCGCKKCSAMLKSEGSVAASILTWANRLSAALDEVYPGIVYGVFAYLGTNKPPRTVRPNEHIAVTYCYDSNCAVHVHDGRDCDETAKISYLEGWLDICDKVYVWGYGMDEGFMTSCYTGMMRDNLRYFHDAGVKGYMWEAEDAGFSTGKIAKWLAAGLTWNIDMSDEEYDEYFDRVVAALYGDGGPYVKEYCAALGAIRRSAKCASSGFTASATPTFAPEMIAPAFDTFFELTETALRLVDSRSQEIRMTKLCAACIYQGCAASYFAAYGAGDDDRVAELVRRYDLIESRLEACGMNARSCWQGGIVVWEREDWESDMEVMAWKSWKKNASILSLTLPEREMPERVAAILAEHGE